MFTDTITITINAVAKVLNRINQDGYSSEYYLKGTLDEYRLKLRNTKYTDKARGQVVDRHNVELVHVVYPTTLLPLGIQRKFYSVQENDNTDIIVDNAKFGAGSAAFLTEANITKLLNWES